MRTIKNKLTMEYDRLEKVELRKTDPDLVKFDELGQGALRKAVVEGDIEHGSIMAGQIAGLINKEETAKEIIDSFIIETKEIIKMRYSQWV